MALQIYLDFKSADSQLAFKPTLELIEKTKVDVNWLPFNSLEEPHYTPHHEETKSYTHKRVRQEQTRQTHQLYAKHRGVPLNYPTSAHKSDLALACLLAINELKQEFIRICLDAYWCKNADLNDRRIVTSLLQSVGAETDFMNSSTYLDVFSEHQAKAVSNRVFFAPTYVYQDQLFAGRQQLPLIESLICSN